MVACFQIASLGDLRKKWHIPPAFSVEFIGYYLDRVSRLQEGKVNLQEQVDANNALATEQRAIRTKYDEVGFIEILSILSTICVINDDN